MSQTKNEILQEWVTAAQKYTSGHSRYMDFVMTTLKAGNDISMKHSSAILNGFADYYARLSMGLGTAIAAVSQHTGQKISIRRGKIKATTKAIEGIEKGLLNHQDGRLGASSTSYLGYDNFRYTLDNFAIHGLLGAVKNEGISHNGVSDAAIRRRSREARKLFAQHGLGSGSTT